MEATEPMTLDQAAESLLMPEQEEKPESDDQITDGPDTETDQTEVVEDEEEPEDLESDDDPEQDEEPEQPALYTVKVDGKEVQVSLEELTRSYSGQEYIQKGMKEAAEARKKADAELQAFQYQQQQLNQLVELAQQGGFVPPEPPTRELLQSDPIAYMEQRAVYDEDMAQYNQAVQQYQMMQHQSQAQQQEAQKAYLAEERRKLHEAIPAIADPKKGPELQAKIRDIGINRYGFTEEELRGIADSRAARALHDAMMYHELIANVDKAGTKAAKARPVAKAGARPNVSRQREQKMRERLKKSGSLEDAAALMLKPQ